MLRYVNIDGSSIRLNYVILFEIKLCSGQFNDSRNRRQIEFSRSDTLGSESISNAELFYQYSHLLSHI